MPSSSSGASTKAIRAARTWTEIRKAADRAALVTQQLLAFSRRQILQPRLVHVPDVVTRSVRLLHRILPGHIIARHDRR